MTIKKLDYDLTVCKLPPDAPLHLPEGFFCLARTDEELSLVCETSAAPDGTLAREDGWKAFRIEGVLDFSLVGILARITGVLAGEGIGIFAMSTYNTDYVLVKQENFDRALRALEGAGYTLL